MFGQEKPNAILPRPNVLEGVPTKRHFLSRLGQLDNERQPFIPEWIDITDLTQSRRGRFLTKDRTPRRHKKIINNTATLARRTLASGMMSGASSPARPWYKLGVGDPDLAEYQPVKLWLETVQRRMNMVLAKSNFYNGLHTLYGDLGDIGNASMIIDENFHNVINCTVLAPGEYYWAVSETGVVDTVYRDYTSTVRQLVERYGKNVSRYVMNLYDTGNYEQYIDVLVAIEPNMRQIEGMRGPQGMKYIQVELEKNDEDDNKLLRRTGRNEWPAPSPRWDVMAGDVYGNGCGLDALGDNRGMQTLERRKAQGIDKMMTPPTQGPLSTQAAMVSHLPGGHTFTPAQSRATISPVYQVPPEGINAAGQEIQRHEKRIDRAYYSDLFLMMAQSDRREITAREIVERHEEKLLALGPVLERLHNELLNVSIDRVFGIMARAGLFPDPPQELKSGMELQAQYISVLAQAQQAVAIGGIERVAGFVGNLSAIYPEARHKFDALQAIDEYANSVGVPVTIIRGDDDVDKLIQQDNQAAQAAQATAAAPGLAQSAQVLADTEVTPDSLLGQLVGA